MKTRSKSARPLHELLLEASMARNKAAEADRQMPTFNDDDDVYQSSPASPDVVEVVDVDDDGIVEESYDSDYEIVQMGGRPSGYDDDVGYQHQQLMDTGEHSDHSYAASYDGYASDTTVAYQEEMEQEQRFDIESTDFIDVTSLDDDDFIVEQLVTLSNRQEDTASAYEEYMMHRVESEQEDEVMEAVRDMHEREVARLQRKADEEQERVAERDRQMRERNRKFQERAESRKLEKRRDELEREEAILAKKIAIQQAKLLQTERQHSQDRIAQSENEEAERAAIARINDELRLREQRLRDMVAYREAQEEDLRQQQEELLTARQRAETIRKERIKATKDSDDHPHSLALRYSRGCGVCLAANPRRRAVLVACGHMTCATCAEQMATTSTEFSCPFCRKLTTYVKTFEDLEDAQEVRPTVPAPDTRKRKIVVGPSNSFGKKIKFVKM